MVSRARSELTIVRLGEEGLLFVCNQVGSSLLRRVMGLESISIMIRFPRAAAWKSNVVENQAPLWVLSLT